ncbi:uncharacterized protein LOC127854757 [Dreissena polymorpha]|uniref:uncharacterized protein LOC127854757 n=1 Tax=Dreissena polymorpha TaxID=45954 RepID=UPI0022641FDF|nr:uncharacterized protein LOC127854757 [Dreissena polymorpha]
MGVFKGRKRKGLVLASRKRYSLCKKRKKPEFQQRTSERNPGMKRVFTSTPCKTPHNRSFTIFNSPLYKRARLMSPIKQQGGSPFFPKVKQSRKLDFMSERNDSFGRENTNSSLDETYLYSENGFGNSRLMTSFAEGDVASETGSISVIERDITCEEFTADDNTYTLFIDAMKILREQSVDGEIVSFLNLVSSRRFPLDNVAFQLFLDVVKWFDCEDVRTMRYNDTTMKFFWLGKRLFGGRFLRFMAGPKHETSILQGHSQLHPSSSKINFACPSNSVLSQFNPLGFELNCDVSTGLIDHMLDLVAKNSKETISYVLMFDGKKIKRGADADLLGFEKEPLSEKKLKFDSDIAIVSTMLQKSKEIEALMECGKSINDKVTSDLFQEIMKCFKVVSKHLMALRQLKKNKEMALHKYKEKIHKNSSLAKTFEYAIDSCKTTLYLIDNCVASLLDVQFVICKTGAYINGCLKLFPRHRGESVNVNNLDNVKMLKIEQADNLPTEQVKQKTERWYKDRHEMKITGSTVYSAIGLDGLKRCQSHFDGIISGVHSDDSTEAQKKAMNHGIASETHEIATLAGIVMPFLFPNSIYCEEGYYIENKMMVSPDGSLRDNTGLNVECAFEALQCTCEIHPSDSFRGKSYRFYQWYYIYVLDFRKYNSIQGSFQ